MFLSQINIIISTTMFLICIIKPVSRKEPEHLNPELSIINSRKYDQSIENKKHVLKSHLYELSSHTDTNIVGHIAIEIEEEIRIHKLLLTKLEKEASKSGD